MKGWQPPRREVVLEMGITPTRSVAEMKWGARFQFEWVHLRFRTHGWEGEWKLHGVMLRRAGTADTFAGRQLGSIPDWLSTLIEQATLEVQLHG